jgi:glycosyltransferase involved in cell wall biosynthesis
MAENGVDPRRFPPAPAAARRRPRTGPLRLAFAGRLVPCKGVELAIAAVAPHVRAGRAVFDVYGDGPEMARLRAQVAALDVAEGVRLHGWTAQGELLARLGAADVFLFPSIREFGGGALLEAMAAGLVPVVLAWGGPRELVTEGTGIVLPLPDRATVVAGIGAAVQRLADDADLLQRLAEGAFRRATGEFSWQVKARQTVEVYRWVTGARPDPPAPASAAFA